VHTVIVTSVINIDSVVHRKENRTIAAVSRFHTSRVKRKWSKVYIVTALSRTQLYEEIVDSLLAAVFAYNLQLMMLIT